MNLYPIGKPIACAFTEMIFRVRYEGLENIPKQQGFILASNHRSAWDPMFVAKKVPQQLNFMAKIELFRNPFTAFILRSANAFPVDRGKGDTGAILEARHRLEKGNVLAIFIEGHRSKDGTPLRPRSGAALIAGQTGADVLPCAIIFSGKLRFRTPVTVRYGSVIKNESLLINLESPATLKAASKQIMGEIIELIGE